MKTDHITGAELQTLREACGLSRDELGTLAGVQARTIKHWENGRAGVPADVVATLERIEDIIRTAVRQLVIASMNSRQDHVILTRHAAETWWQLEPAMHGLPIGVHGAIIGRTRQALIHPGRHVRVVNMDAEDYRAWRAARKLDDTTDARSAWAADQVTAQALPHRADQPPPSH